MLSPKNHALAHELLFKHFMVCVEKTARAYISMLGEDYSQIRSAEDLPDEYDIKIQDAYNVLRKRTVISTADMSIKKIGFFEKTPAGCVDIVKSSKKTVIYNTATKAIFRKWPITETVPDGWKTASQLSDAEKTVFNMRQ